MDHPYKVYYFEATSLTCRDCNRLLRWILTRPGENDEDYCDEHVPQEAKAIWALGEQLEI